MIWHIHLSIKQLKTQKKKGPVYFLTVEEFQEEKPNYQQQRRDQELKGYQRKVAPFFQSMNDIRICALEDRREMLEDEAFAYKGQDYIDNLRNRYHQKDIWAPYKPRYSYMYNATHRNVKEYKIINLQRYENGYEIKNV
ncbi:hypothetical protein IMG5_125430 [Ichthyophthirius multifiliis]|uniref:Uncharacterized protein n=1 Tax=Ichthyophthirius multifiliis TaxID=5932 RepID=G0QVQ9_ICHMU|nr:hypothetical protein IMG5_125430 [Ichthyophthirius multifiliis]EGR30703.1 hypothetical protein IMG5_125430 [Ichthyophthirius multifiliis]|eukprot:XP_004032290.1 hypothetical protein IMG5_125430 [Ichthyophthirius multifiliis]